jgi:hypothetical protein
MLVRQNLRNFNCRRSFGRWRCKFQEEVLLGKMGDVTKGEGRTVLFVNHNMAYVQKEFVIGEFC